MLKKCVHFFKLFLLILWLVSSIAWAALAIYYGDSYSGSLQLTLSIAMVLIGLTIILLFWLSPAWRNRLLLIHSVVFMGVLFWWFNIQPSNDRHWQVDVSKLAHASIENNRVTVHNIRNFHYRDELDYSPDYYDKTFDLDKLEGVDLFAVYWMGPEIAHIIISFDFGEHDHLAISIEARKEMNEGYSTLKGFFRQYELVYIVADERDVIGLRTNFRNNPPEQVYRYRIDAPKENIRPFFLEYVEKINVLYKKPAFYNTLLSNCTTLIWLHSRVNQEHLPFSWKILLSGYVPEYLYESGRFNQKLSFAELKEQGYVNPRITTDDIPPLFSSMIRSKSVSGEQQ